MASVQEHGRREMESKYTRHGGAHDRGMADAWYGRPRAPHYFTGGTNTSPKVEEADMTPEEIAAYHAGYESETGRKEWT